MNQGLNDLICSVQVLTLSKGLHLITVTSAAPQRLGDDGELMLPAVHIGVGPGVAAGQVEIMPGPRNSGCWLFEARDMLVVRVAAAQAVLMLTTVRAAPLPAIGVEVTRLDRRTAPTSPSLAALAPPRPPEVLAPPPAPTPFAAPKLSGAPTPPALKTASGRTALSARVDLHIQNQGDVAYVNNFWASAWPSKPSPSPHSRAWRPIRSNTPALARTAWRPAGLRGDACAAAGARAPPWRASPCA
jgi:hypothetical protein